jgi:thioesterase domain-containing protein
MKYQVITPSTAEEWQRYYQLRYQVLRQPWGQPPGSERDELEADSAHRMVMGADGAVLAVGRVHQLADGWCQVRYMAVAEAARGKGLGALVLRALEHQGLAWGARQLTLNARENAYGFYQNLGYQAGRALEPLYGIAHQQMTKRLRLDGSAAEWLQWCGTLQQTWHQTIPLSAFMQLSVDQFDGHLLACRAPLPPNKNLHHSMFAGSIYSLLTLTGWGLVWLQLQALGLHGDIVLADADIRYLAPVRHDARAEVLLSEVLGDLTPLHNGRKVRQQLTVRLIHSGQVLAEFHGRFAVLPAQPAASEA